MHNVTDFRIEESHKNQTSSIKEGKINSLIEMEQI
jgi:hypothetical protein